MQREIKEQQDHSQPLFYLEDDPEEHVEETMEGQENQFSPFSNEEYEVETHEEGGEDLDAPLDDGEIDNYYRKFSNFMQAQLHRKSDLRSSKKRWTSVC